jgi:cell division septation protein DedD
LRNKRVIILIALLAVIGAGGWFFFLRGEEPEPTTEVISKKIKIAGGEEAPGAPGGAFPAIKPEKAPFPPPGTKKAPVPKPPTAAKIAKKPAASSPPAPEPPAAKVKRAALTSPYAVNVSSFSHRADAVKLSGALTTDGYNSYVTEFTHKNQRWYRVRVGFFPTRGEADRIRGELAAKLNTPGAWVVKPTRSEVSKHMK